MKKAQKARRKNIFLSLGELFLSGYHWRWKKHKNIWIVLVSFWIPKENI